MKPWSLAYFLAVICSFICTLGITCKLYRNGNLLRSAVRFILFFFFVYLTLWSLCRGIFFGLVLVGQMQQYQAKVHDEYDDSNEKVDAMGARGMASAQTITFPVALVMIFGDTALVATSIWMFPLAHELFKVARISMDRGAVKERIVIWRYCVVIHSLIAGFLVVQLCNAIGHGGYNEKAVSMVVIAQSIQLLGIVYIFVALVILKCKGRKYESLHGEMVPSPLYRRLRNLVIVFGVFSLQHQFISIGILLRPNLDNRLPPVIIGMSSLVFRSIGTALAYVMGCSQECIVNNCQSLLPEEYVQRFHEQSRKPMELTTIRPPIKDPVFVFTDIEASSSLWAIGDGSLMRVANEMHDDVMRSLLFKYHGYEITTVGDAFQLAFHTIKDAVEYCVEVQLTLLDVKWPKELLTSGNPAVKTQKLRGRTLFHGLRVRMGIHDASPELEGTLVTSAHPVTGKTTYTGLSQVIASELGDLGHGGQILVTSRVAQWINAYEDSLDYPVQVERVGKHHVSQVDVELDLAQLLVEPLDARKSFFGALRRRDSGCALQIVVHNPEMSVEQSSCSSSCSSSSSSSSPPPPPPPRPSIKTKSVLVAAAEEPAEDTDDTVDDCAYERLETPRRDWSVGAAMAALAV